MSTTEGSFGVVIGPDGRPRTPWAVKDPLLMEYYDTEWGMPVPDERALFERICLEAFQAGLSWLTVLGKRDAFREVFYGFDPEKVSQLSDDVIEQLLANPDIIRNRRKIEATRTNARATIDLRAEGGLEAFLWSFKPDTTPAPRNQAEVPTSSPESKAMSIALRKRGFVFVGPTTMYALMEAIGMVDTHVVGSHRRGVSGVW